MSISPTSASQCGSSDNGMMGYLGPESLTGGIYDTKRYIPNKNKQKYIKGDLQPYNRYLTSM